MADSLPSIPHETDSSALATASRAAPTLSIVIPAHDEARSLPGLLAEIAAAMVPDRAQEVVVVDDASDDGTWRGLVEAAARWPWLHPVRHEAQAGQSAALLSGVRAAGGEWVATLDGDGQNDPRDIAALVAVRDGMTDWRRPLLITGERRDRHDGWSRRVSSSIANRVRGRLLGDHTPDTGCGLKLFQRAAFLDLPWFDHGHRFMPALFLRAGGRVVSVPVSHRARREGRSHYGVNDRLWVGLVDLLGVMWLKRRWRHPEVYDPRQKSGSELAGGEQE